MGLFTRSKKVAPAAAAAAPPSNNTKPKDILLEVGEYLINNNYKKAESFIKEELDNTDPANIHKKVSDSPYIVRSKKSFIFVIFIMLEMHACPGLEGHSHIKVYNSGIENKKGPVSDKYGSFNFVDTEHDKEGTWEKITEKNYDIALRIMEFLIKDKGVEVDADLRTLIKEGTQSKYGKPEFDSTLKKKFRKEMKELIGKEGGGRTRKTRKRATRRR